MTVWRDDPAFRHLPRTEAIPSSRYVHDVRLVVIKARVGVSPSKLRKVNRIADLLNGHTADGTLSLQVVTSAEKIVRDIQRSSD